MADGGFDPRYDPAFQRGYSGAARPATARPADPTPPIRSAPAAAAPARVGRPVAELVPEATAPVASAVAPPPVASEVPDPPVGRDPRRNPFLLAAAALGVACLLAGGFWLSRTQQFFDTGAQSGGDFWIVMVSLVGSPLLLALGVAILAGVLFFLARHWQQQPGVRSDSAGTT